MVDIVGVGVGGCFRVFLKVCINLIFFMGVGQYSFASDKAAVGLGAAMVLKERGALVRDPTSPVIGGGSRSYSKKSNDKKESLILNGIYKRGSHFIALINGLSVQEGDSIMGKVITKIEHNKVIFNGNESGVISLYPKVTTKR